MQFEGHALGADGLANSGAQPGPAGSARSERVIALGYVSARGLVRLDDPELTEQAETIEGFCARRGWELRALIREIEPPSTRSMGRPSLTHALERLSRGDASCLVVAELRRLCRSVAQLSGILEALEQADARLVSLEPPIDTGTRFGRAAVSVLTSVSAWERDRRAQMTSAARAKVIPLRIQPDLKRRIERMRSAGMTLHAIANELNEEQVPTVRGGTQWRPSSVQAALGYKRPRLWAPQTAEGPNGRRQ
jgi:DNA invertase Pin-like site-specific DNA recombinase